MGDINEFFDNLMIRIRARCEKSGNRQGCQLWTGAKTGGYGRMRVRYPDGTSTLEYVSLLIYKTLCIPNADDEGNPLDVSHLCHNGTGDSWNKHGEGAKLHFLDCEFL